MSLIEAVLAREVLDSRGNPTIEVDAILVDGAERAQAIAEETMNKAKDIVGFIRKR